MSLIPTFRSSRRVFVGLVAVGLSPLASISPFGCGGEAGDTVGRGSVSVPRAGAGVVDTNKGESKPASKAAGKSARKVSD